jgi:hypothetical protein
MGVVYEAFIGVFSINLVVVMARTTVVGVGCLLLRDGRLLDVCCKYGVQSCMFVVHMVSSPGCLLYIWCPVLYVCCTYGVQSCMFVVHMVSSPGCLLYIWCPVLDVCCTYGVRPWQSSLVIHTELVMMLLYGS